MSSAPKPRAKNPSELPPPAPSRAQKREIAELLAAVYDTAAGCYLGCESDATVAAVLGFPERPGWVAQLRQDLFGDNGGNQDIDGLSARMKVLEGQLSTLSEEIAASVQMLEKIRIAVGPAALRRAGQRP
ncbi:hypothetical protein KM176_24170 [Pseudooceanicola sp. CBS1P-1]|uniref:hypothetical protein n=1 Tax=Pseudooceanicola TaxID=1679449 RepID=UPI00136BE876|nr:MULTISPECIES: hypothetical protein [Pseudooceanicola]MBT9386958.1 hypothetical protein [Pseudooceanicola endophyticus]